MPSGRIDVASTDGFLSGVEETSSVPAGGSGAFVLHAGADILWGEGGNFSTASAVGHDAVRGSYLYAGGSALASSPTGPQSSALAVAR